VSLGDAAPFLSRNTWNAHPTKLIEAFCRCTNHRFIAFKETFYDHEHGHLQSNHFLAENVAFVDATLAVIRDPRDVWQSVTRMMKRKRPEQDWSSVNDRFVNNWNHFARWVHNNPGVVVTRYEDLVTAPQEELRRVSEQIGISFRPEMLNLQPRTGEGDPKALSGSKVSDSSVGKFADRLSRQNISFIEVHCGDLMGLFGYELFGHEIDS